MCSPSLPKRPVDKTLLLQPSRSAIGNHWNAHNDIEGKPRRTFSAFRTPEQFIGCSR